MHKITKIERQKKSLQRYNVYIDNEFAFGVDEDVLLKNNLHKGLQLTKDDMIQLVDEESTRNAYLLSIRYLSYRIRTKSEIETYLREKAVEEILINETIERLVQEKLIDDIQFAEVFVRDRMNQTSKGPRIIEKELMEKGITKSIASDAIKAFTYEQQLEKVVDTANKEMEKRSNKSSRQRLQQIQSKLIRQGFGQDVIQDMLQNIEVIVDEDDEKNALHKQAEKISKRLRRKYTGHEFNQHLKRNLYGKGFSIDLINEYINELEMEQ